MNHAVVPGPFSIIDRRMSTQPSLLMIQLLGNFQATDRHERQLLAESERLQALLAYLVLHSHAPQPRQHLAFLFWPDAPESQARTNLRNLLHRLRRLLPQANSFLWVDATHVQWRPDAPFTCDALDFEQAFQEAQTHLEAGRREMAERALRRAIELYRGDLMPACYEEWLLPLRERFRQAALEAFEALISLLETRHAYEEATHYCQTWLRLDPLDERAYRTLMRLHALRGNRAAALQAYHTCLTTLREELGVEPDAATREVYDRLLHNTLQREQAGPRTARGAPLIGRDEAWGRLRALWQTVRAGQVPPQCALITGEAGIGKSRLAEEFVSWARRQGFTTAVAASYAAETSLAFEPITTWLRCFQPLNLPPAWAQEVARLLPDLLDAHPHLHPPAPLQESWQRRRFFDALVQALLTQRQPILLMLDDAHWVDSETLEWLVYLLHHATDARLLLLLTARHEALTPSHPLEVATDTWRSRGQLTLLSLARLNQAQSSQLAAHLAGRSLSPETSAAIFRHTEGNPLFIVEYANAGLETLTDDAPLPETAHNLLVAHFRQVSPNAQEIAQAAAILGPCFTTDRLAGLIQSDEPALLQGLDELWQRHLIRETGPAAYAFSHHKLWQVIYEQITPGHRRALHHQAAELFRVLAPHDLRGQAFHYEQAGQRQAALDLYVEAARQEMDRFAYRAAQELLQHALALADERPTPQLVDIWTLLAEIADLLGEQEESAQAIAQALRLAHVVGDPRRQARAQHVAGLLATKTGQHIEAAVYFEQALKLAQAHRDTAQALDTLLAWGELAIRSGDMGAARHHFEEALALARQAQAATQEAEALDGLGFIYPALGEPPEEAERALRQALALRRAIGDQLGEARTLCNLTSLLQSRGAHDQALQMGQEALARNEAVGNRRGVAATQGAMGLAASALGDFETAQPLLQAARETLAALEDVVGLTIATANLALATERANRLPEAANLYRQALKLALAHEAALFAAIARHDLARVLIKQGAWSQALELLPDAEEYFQEEGDRLSARSCRTLRGRALLALGQREEAKTLAEASWEAWQTGTFSGDLLPDWLWHLADLLTALGDRARARQVIAAAYTHLQETAAAIQDETRRRAFFERVHVHRCICEAYAQQERRP